MLTNAWLEARPIPLGISVDLSDCEMYMSSGGLNIKKTNGVLHALVLLICTPL